MIPQRLLNQPLTITRRMTSTTVDRYGNQVATFATPTATTGFLSSSASVERVNERDVITIHRECFFQAATLIGPLDRVTYQGQVFEVDGEPERVWNPRTAREMHVRARLVSVEGG